MNAMLNELNMAFAGANIQFVHFGPIDEFESAELHRIECISEYETLLSTNNIPNAIDVYFVDQLLPDACDCPSPTEVANICISLAGKSSSTASEFQGVVIRNCGLEAHNPCSCGVGGPIPLGECGDCDEEVIMGDCAIDTPKVFIHEMGHYFDLLHLHETAWGTECPGINQANCSTCGDFLCGTGAEPAPSEYTVEACVATLNDPQEIPPGCTAPYQPPDVTNYMSSKAEAALCRSYFNRSQLARARATLLNLRAGELW